MYYSLCELLAPWVHSSPKSIITGITLDSRNIITGNLFIAINGHKTDGRNYIIQAIQQGAAAVLTHNEDNTQNNNINMLYHVPIIFLDNLNALVSELANRFYDNPSKKIRVIGVTGTNGKTTITHLLAQWVNMLGEQTSIMGTLGNGILGKLQNTTNTTVSAIEVQQLLAQFYNCGVSLTAMEVSSHGLVQHRVNSVHYEAAIFTNLTHDHMDYHNNINEYEAAKWRLFSELDVKYRIINIDDAIGYRWITKLPYDTIIVSTKSIRPVIYNHQWIYAIKINYYNNGTEIIFHSSWGNGILNSPLIGEFNVSNLLLTLATLLTLNYPLQYLLDTVQNLCAISGRMEMFNVIGYPKILIDYAHTPDALMQVLITARRYCYGKLWCVFGCGGERDKEKRPFMGAIAEQYADKVIITNDNSRNEPIKNIVNDILYGVLNVNVVVIILDRIQAINYAIKHAKVNDLILIAGKGHEIYQVIGTKKFHYSDRIIVNKILGYKS